MHAIGTPLLNMYTVAVNPARPATIYAAGASKGESVIGAAWSPKGTALAYLVRPRADDCVGLPSKLETVSANGKHIHTLARWSAQSLMSSLRPRRDVSGDL